VDEKRLPPEVVRCLDDYRSRARSFAIVKGAALTVTVYVVIVVVAALLDRFVRMPAWLRAVLSFGSISAVLALAYYALIRPFVVRPGARETALDLERTDPDFNEGLVTTVDHLATDGMPTAFSRALLSEVARGSANIAGELDVSDVMPARLVRRILVVSLVAVAVFAALFAVPGLGFARLVARFHAPLANMPRASLIELKVQPGSKVVGVGDSEEIRASLSAPYEGRVVLHVRPEGESWTESEMASRAASAALAPEGPRPLDFARKIDVVTSTFDYYVTAGDAESAAYRIVAVDRPLPELFRVTYKPPAYTGSPPNTEEGPTGAVRGLKGSHVTLSIKPSVAVAEAKLVKDGFSIPMVISEEGMLAACEFELEKDGSYSLQLAGAHGLANREGREYPIKALDDAPPTVNANLIRAGSRVDPEGALRIRYDARDDWGVEGVRSFVSLNGGDAEAKDLAVAQPGRKAASDFLVDLATLSAKRGDHVSVLVSARDALGQVGRSREVMVWLGRDVTAREAAERAKRIAAAAEAVREMEKLQQVLQNDRAELAELMKEEAWSPESERKHAEVRRL
jgi:hypothetical protein